ncbi:MAG: hypothetical protein BWK80_50345, partial [Desulfobacteraceae bacterium IS3]
MKERSRNRTSLIGVILLAVVLAMSFTSAAVLVGGVFSPAYADTITTIAGQGGVAGFAGDGGPATAAKFNAIYDITKDSAGNIYIADAHNHRIRKIDTSGIVSTIAGTGVASSSGDGGIATAATLNTPYGVAVDSAGNIFIVEVSGHRIRKVNTSGIISTVAGTGAFGYSGDGGPATAAQLYKPNDIAFDSVGNIYITDSSNACIRKINASGIISTAAGTCTVSGYSEDGTPATKLSGSRIEIDSADNIYILDNYSVRKINTAGIITTVAGNGTNGYSGDGGIATSAMLNKPYGVGLDSTGNVYIADCFNKSVRKVDTSGIITTFSGNGTQGFSGDGGEATSAQMYNPSKVLQDNAGNILIADCFNHCIRKVTVTPTDSICNSVTEIPVAECKELLSLYNSTDGANWKNKTGWNQTNTPCSWFGVRCEAGHVATIFLSDDGNTSDSIYGNGLKGQIPNLNLPNLQWLMLNNNQLSGSIPNFSNLPNLRVLWLGKSELSGACLSGSIPNFSNLPNLEDLRLDGNQLSGSIPNFSNLPNLQGLYLTSNQLSGTIPNFSNLPNLKNLWLGANQLSGSIPNFSYLPKLAQLWLFQNQLSGTIPNFTAFNLSGLQSAGFHINCGLTAFDAAQKVVLDNKDPIWQHRNPNCPIVVPTVPTITYQKVPADYQLYPREADNSAVVSILGTIATAGYDSVKAKVYKVYDDGRPSELMQPVQEKALTYSGGKADFSLDFNIYAGLVEYKVEIYAVKGGTEILHKTINNVVCGDVFLIYGQSNAVGWSSIPEQSKWVRSFGTSVYSSSVDPAASQTGTSWGIAQGLTRNSYLSAGWGVYLGKMISDAYKIPVCIINGAVGGKPISSFLRYEADPDSWVTAYGRMLYRAEKAGVKDKVKAILWHQGESDTASSSLYPVYADKFDKLYKAWMENYPGIEKVYTFQLHPHTCISFCESYQANIREVQRTLPSRYSNVEVMSTVGINEYDGCHYTTAGYKKMTEGVFRQVAKDFYGQSYDSEVKPPDIIKAYYTNAANTEIALVFNQEVVWDDNPKDGVYFLKDNILLDGNSGCFSSGYSSGKVVKLTLNGSCTGSKISYVPTNYYVDKTNCCESSTNGCKVNAFYNGPWIMGKNGVGALAFYEFPVAQGSGVDVWVADPAPDDGTEPSKAKKIYISPWVWVRNTDDGKEGYQNPIYGQDNYVYVRVENRGISLATDTKVEVYRSDASIGRAWGLSKGWFLVGTADIKSLEAGKSTVARIRWDKGSIPTKGHYCFYVRLLNDQDPMTFPEGNNLIVNTVQNNNIAWRNFNVVNLVSKVADKYTVKVGNPADAPVAIELLFDEKEELLQNDGAKTIVDLGATLFQRWQESGGKGENLKVLSGTEVQLSATPAKFIGIPLNVGEEFPITMRVDAFKPMPGAGTSREYHFSAQEFINGELIGGVDYTIITRAQDTDSDGDGIKDVVDTDNDNDGIPDDWEIKHGLNPLDKADADEDADNDGISNLDEYKANTDPNDPASKPADPTFKTGIFTVDDTGIVKIDWLYDGGKYQGEFGIFSIVGMENLTPGSPEFIAEAAKRVLSDSEQGYLA